VVVCKAEGVPVDLQADGHVEIFGDVALGLELGVATVLCIISDTLGISGDFLGISGDLLDCTPADESVVANKGSCLTTTDGEANGRVDEVGEVSDGMIKPVPRDLHDPGAMLRNVSLLPPGWLVHSLELRQHLEKGTSRQRHTSDSLLALRRLSQRAG
jgi:hypothetical protein